MTKTSADLHVGDRVVFEHGDLRWTGVIDKISPNEYDDDSPMATVILDGDGVGVEGPLAGFDPEPADHEWRHCSPDLLSSGVHCPTTLRRPCLCGPGYGSHDHLVPTEHEFALDHDTGVSFDYAFDLWRWLCSCGERGNWQAVSGDAAERGWREHVEEEGQ